MIKYTSYSVTETGLAHFMQQCASHDICEMGFGYLQHGYSISRLRRRTFQLDFGCPDLGLREAVPTVNPSDARSISQSYRDQALTRSGLRVCKNQSASALT